ncbi:hypothetical protein [Cellulosimicrobium sp. CUA-896]|uniref:hypothetical protein n=1 Tax=Cellulosimicrobium sp. CUA-896 TaxID=1517881 RepID=UPI00095A1E40|nr:hypothetical protein [Cellulosimicrobium sp. CUA-896]OLT54455.1 hypothetical protein BJF88_08915 [Cellulosimicrobium sp. CUA-896]
MNVYVVLSRSRTVLSRTIALATRDEFTHASLALDPGLELMFSFGRRRAGNPFVGCFRRERFDDGLYRGMDTVPGVVVEIPVTLEQHEAVCTRISEFLLDSHAYSYNASGLVNVLIGRGSPDDTRFFCSEFVYHVLQAPACATSASSAGRCDRRCSPSSPARSCSAATSRRTPRGTAPAVSVRASRSTARACGCSPERRARRRRGPGDWSARSTAGSTWDQKHDVPARIT